MPLLSFEGVEVDIPTSLAGIQFAFRNGALSIQCTSFTGEIMLSRPVTASAPTPASVCRTNTTDKKRSLDPSSFVGDDDDADDSADSSTSDLLPPKRARPTDPKAAEQAMLQAHLESILSPDALKKPKTKAKTLVAPSTLKSVKASVPTAAAPTSVKKPTNTVQTTLFSPDATSKSLGARKATPESQSKQPRSRTPKAESASSAKTTAKARAAVAKAKPRVTAQWHDVPTTGSLPVERWGDSATTIGNNRVVVYGGADDDDATLGSVHVLDLVTRQWSMPLNCESIPRAWHDAVWLEAKNLLLVFGGERFMGDDQIDVLSDIMVLDTACFLWYPPAVSGTAPTARSGHSCTVVGDDVVVFGGSRGRSRQSSVHVLDTTTWHWRHVKVDGKAPAARTYHSAVAIGTDRVVIFGGNDAKTSFDAVHVLQKKSDDHWVWTRPRVVGATMPRARTGHSATLVDSSRILVFGGWDPQSEEATAADGAPPAVFDDAFLLDTATWEWTPVAITSTGGDNDDKPLVRAMPGRVGHCAVLDAHNNVLLFGGQDANEKRLNSIHSITLRLDAVKDEQPEPERDVTTQLKLE